MNLSYNESVNASSSQIYAVIYRYICLSGIPLSLFGLFANSLILLILFTEKCFYKMTYYLIRISITSDIVTIMTNLLVYFYAYDYHLDDVAGTVLCRVGFFIGFCSYGISMMNLELIAIDRYFIIVKSISPYYRLYQRHFLVIGQVIAWLVVIPATIPTLYYLKVNSNITLLCDIPAIQAPQSTYLFIMTFVIYFIPAIAIFLTYWKVITNRLHYQRPGHMSVLQQQREETKNKKFIKMLITITFSYILITWPFFVTLIGLAITRTSLRQLAQTHLGYFLLSVLSIVVTTGITIINPLIYCRFDKVIRRKVLARLKILHLFRTDIVSTTMTPSTLAS